MSDWDDSCPCGNDSACTRCGAGDAAYQQHLEEEQRRMEEQHLAEHMDDVQSRIAAASMELETIQHVDDPQLIRVIARVDGVEVASIDYDTDARAYDYLEMPDDEQLIRHFGIEAAGGDAAGERAFEDARSDFEYHLAEHLSDAAVREATRLGIGAAPLGSVTSAPQPKPLRGAPGTPDITF